jgi:hypothetical protein
VKNRWFGILAAMTMLTGCSIPQTGVDSLLTPPLLNEEQNEIYAALVRETGDNIKLLYPQKGENRSAFLVINLDSEVTSEAVAFYQSTAANITAAIHMAVLDKRDGEWQSVHDISLDGTQVEDVSVMRVGGQPLLAVGLTYSSDNTSLLKVYSFNGSTMDEICSESYQAKAISDLDSDDEDDVVLVTAPNEDGSASAKLLVYEDGDFKEGNLVAMDPSITRYTNITSGYLKNGQKAIYLDGYRGSNLMTTEILGYEEDTGLVNLTYNPEAPQRYPIDRTVGAVCFDTNKDSIIEVPGLTLLPGYTEEVAGAFYLTDWYHFFNGEFEKVKSSYVNSSQGYMLDFPENWLGTVSVKRTVRGNETLFFEYQLGDNPVRSELLYIQMAKRSDWEAGKFPGYEIIDSAGGGQIVYLAKIPEDANWKLAMSMIEVKKNFNRYY